MADKELQVQDKKELEAAGEPTKAGAVFTPAVDIFENQDEIILVADMPGVGKDGADIHLEENQLRIRGTVSTEVPGTLLISEYPSGDFVRTFTLSDAIDQSKIEAGMKDGVLRVRLPKSEATKPRKIAVKTG